MREKRTDASLGNPNQASAGTKKPAEPEDRVLERTSKASRLTLSGRRPSFGVCGFGDLGFWGLGKQFEQSNSEMQSRVRLPKRGQLAHHKAKPAYPQLIR